MNKSYWFLTAAFGVFILTAFVILGIVVYYGYWR